MARVAARELHAERWREARRLRYVRKTCLSESGLLRTYHVRDKDMVCIFCAGDPHGVKHRPRYFGSDEAV